LHCNVSTFDVYLSLLLWAATLAHAAGQLLQTYQNEQDRPNDAVGIDAQYAERLEQERYAD